MQELCATTTEQTFPLRAIQKWNGLAMVMCILVAISCVFCGQLNDCCIVTVNMPKHFLQLAIFWGRFCLFQSQHLENTLILPQSRTARQEAELRLLHVEGNGCLQITCWKALDNLMLIGSEFPSHRCKCHLLSSFSVIPQCVFSPCSSCAVSFLMSISVPEAYNTKRNV